MDSKEFILGIKHLANLHPDLAKKYGHFENAAMVKTWFNNFKQYSLEEFKNGLAKMVCSAKAYPTMAVLIDFVREQYDANVEEKVRDQRRIDNQRILNPSPLPCKAKTFPEIADDDEVGKVMKRVFEKVAERERAEREERLKRLHIVPND